MIYLYTVCALFALALIVAGVKELRRRPRPKSRMQEFGELMEARRLSHTPRGVPWGADDVANP